MFFRLLLLLTLSFKSNFALSSEYKVPDVDFFQSMTDGSKIATEIIQITPKNIQEFKKHYEAKKPSQMLYHKIPLIPKVMHHIWLGSSKIPPLYQNYLNECKKLHPDWEFKFWNDKDIDDLGLEYRDIYDKARSYAGRSDIARYEILYKFGGVYRDMDVKCLRPIDDLNHKYTFFAPIEPPFEVCFYNYGMIPLNNGIIGSAPGNTILKSTLDIIRKNFDKEMHSFDHSNKGSVHLLAIKSSLLPLTYGFLEQSSFEDKNIVLPSTYFFSLLNKTFESKKQFGKLKHLIAKFFNTPEMPSFHFLKPESLMFHNIKDGKREIQFCSFQYGNYVNDLTIKDNLEKLDHVQHKIFSLFQKIYEETIQQKHTHISNQNNKIPQDIHFIVFNSEELSILENLLPVWKMLNGDFEIKIWDKTKIIENFQDIELKNNLSETFRFYLGLRILEKFGGTYASYKAFPHQPIFELNNLYSFYVGLMPLVGKKLSFSHKLIGSKKEHPIISNTLKIINFNDSNGLDKLDEVLVLQTYKEIDLSGANLVLPAIYFEPTIQNNNKIKAIQKLIDKSLAIYTKFTILE